MDLEALYRFADEQNIAVDYFKLQLAESLSVPIGEGYAIAIDQEKIQSSVDEKVKLGHELGHCMTGSFYNRWAKCDVRRRHENRADKWEVFKFLSECDLDDAVANGYTEMYELAEFFGVTEAFMRKAVCWYTFGNLDVEHNMVF